MSADHVIWRSVAGTKYCTLGGLEGVPKQYEIKRGISRASGFPADAHFEMDKRYPKQVALPDSVSNMESMVVVSTALKELVEARAPRSLEILPVRIVNHKGRDAGAAYWIVSPLAIVDAIDQAASQVDWNAQDRTQICGFEQLVLRPGAIPADLLLFRLKHLERHVLARADFAAAVVAGGFTGMKFVPPADFMG